MSKHEGRAAMQARFNAERARQVEQAKRQREREARVEALIAWGCTPYEARIRAEGEAPS